MAEKYVVVCGEGNISWDSDKDKAESFASHTVAKSRAKELAISTPGEVIGIYALYQEVIAPVGKPEIKIVQTGGPHDPPQRARDVSR